MVFVVLVLIVSGVQHVDCVTFSTLSFFLSETCSQRKKVKEKRKGTRERERGRGRARVRERERIRERERKRERERERERKGCFCRRRFFLFLAPGSAREKFAALVNPEDKPTKVNWTLSWPIALEICRKTVL